MNPPEILCLNEYGFYEVRHKPAPEELRDYYAKRYYQENMTIYEAAYPPEELEHIEGKLRLRHWIVEDLSGAAASGSGGGRRFLDIGCGEGWAMDYFQRQGWEVQGLDFSSFSLEKFHPNLRERLRVGDLYDGLDHMAADGESFDVLWLGNVLEHVLAPADLLRQCRALVKPDGLMMVDVPNDFSALQQHLCDEGLVDRPFWVTPPDHLSYFNPHGLKNLAEATGWQVARIMGDHPIDLNLWNPATNYVMNREAGKAAHRARVAQDNFLLRTAPLSAVAAYYEALAGVGLGRSIIAFLQP